MGILKTARFWIAIYFGVGLILAGFAYGATVGAPDCRVINMIFFGPNTSYPEGIVVMTFFWPAILIAGFTATCR